MRRWVWSFFAIIFLLSSSATAFADKLETASPDEWDPVSPGPMNGWSASLCGAGKVVVQPYFYYYHTRGVFDGEGAYKAYTDGETQDMYFYEVLLYLGITDRFEVDLFAGYLDNTHTADDVHARGNGWEDAAVYARYCLFDEGEWMPQVTAIGQMKFPTGKYERGDEAKIGTDITGTGSYDPGFGIILSKAVKPFIFHADFIYSIPIQAKIDGVKTRYADYTVMDFAVEWILPKGFNVLLETNMYIQGDTREDGELVPASDTFSMFLVPGIGWSNDRLQVLVAYQRTIAGTNVDCDDSVAVTVVYTF
jgi:hypothetical protein